MALYQTQATQQNLDRRTANRLQPEQIVRLAQSLPADDRLLLERRFADGLTVTDIARRSRRSATTLRKRIDSLTRRLASPEFRFTLLHQDKMPPAMRRTATLLFIQGRSMRETAEATGKTLHRIRCDRATLQTLAQVHELNEN